MCLSKHHAMKVYGEVEVQLHASLTSARDGSERSASRPGRLTVGERASATHWVGDWVDPRVGLDAVAKRIPALCRKLNPGHPVRSIVSLVTDDAVV
jgi:hypothetical protein